MFEGGVHKWEPSIVEFWGRGRNKLFQKPPWKDEKILLAWNYIPWFAMSHFPKPVLKERQMEFSRTRSRASLQSFPSMLQPSAVQHQARLKSISPRVEPNMACSTRESSPPQQEAQEGRSLGAKRENFLSLQVYIFRFHTLSVASTILANYLFQV